MIWKRIGSAVGTATFAVMALGTVADAAPAAEDEADRVCVVVVETAEAACGESRTEARAGLSTQAAEWHNIASLYNATRFRGTEVLIQSTRERCTSSYDREFEFPDLRDDPIIDININDWISSVRTYNRCDVKLYAGFDFSGRSSTWIDESSNLSNVGSGWNNRASSMRIS